jgi:hypothetical protein
LRKRRTSDDRRPGIAPQRLEQHVGLPADLGELLQHYEAIDLVGDHDQRLEQRRIRDAKQRLLEGRARPEQREELFWMHLARGRP